MMFAAKLVLYFMLWTLYSYAVHVLAHANFKWNLLRPLHLKHHSYKYSGMKWPPLHDYFFWFGSWKGSLDVWITFTLPLVVLWFFEPRVATVLLVFHYVYEVFLSRDVLDHNPNLVGKFTKVIPVGAYHYQHHRNYRCNYAFYICLWDYLFGTVNRERSQELPPQA